MAGFVPSIITVAIIGLVLFTMVTFQVGTGLRWIKLPPRLHWKIHKWNGITLLTIGAVHAVLGLTVAGIIRLP